MYDNLKKYGRNGDTEIVKTSKNSLWHVNKDEKLLIEKFGKHGEDIVDYVGSGTINPTTGLEEKNPMLAIAAGSLLLGGLNTFTSGAAQEDSARLQSKYASEGIARVKNALSQLTKSSRDAALGVTSLFSQKMDDFSDTMGFQKSKIQQGMSSVVEKQDFASSSSVNNEQIEMLRKSIDSGRADLGMRYGQELGKVSTQAAAERARLESEEMTLRKEKEMADASADSFYLGKNLRQITNLFT